MSSVTAALLTVPDTHCGLYVHVPFCVRKCCYCDFPSIPPSDAQCIAQYLVALTGEARQRRMEFDRPLHSIYIGGGTPTLLSPEQLTQLWHDVIAPFPRLPEVEITLEANPGTLTEEKLAVIAALPITRVSLGVQSFAADTLRILGRIHSPEEAESSVHALRAAGIRQVNMDLMYGLPEQTVAEWEATLRRAISLQPDHLSCYALILEEDTPLFRKIQAGDYALPGEETVIAMLATTERLLTAAGLMPYEVSNAALPGAHSRHNLGYWLGRDYLGLGAAASSTVAGVRWRNIAEVSTYTTRCQEALPVVAYSERLSAPERLLERVMLGLRLYNGFDLPAAEMDCGISLTAITGPTVQALIAEGLLMQQRERLCLTATGFPLANQVVTRLMAASG